MAYTAIILFISSIIIPAAFWFAIFSWFDRSEPEPKKKIINIYAAGLGTAFLALILEILIYKTILSPQHYKVFQDLSSLKSAEPYLYVALFSVGIIEESFKFLILKGIIYKDSDFNQIVDGIFYGAYLSLGFATLENMSYFIDLIGSANGTAVIFVRGILTVMLHICATGFSGLGLGKKKFMAKGGNMPVYKALAAAILIHGLFNALAITKFGIIWMSAVTAVAFIFLLREIKKPENKLIWKLAEPAAAAPPPAIS